MSTFLESNITLSSALKDMGAFRRMIFLKDIVLFALLLALFLVLNPAGSHIMAAVGALGGVLGIIGHKIPSPARWPLGVWALLAFTAWVFASSFWSDYQDPRELKNIWRFALGVPLYMLFVYVAAGLHPAIKAKIGPIFGFGVLAMCAYFLFETTSGYPVTRFVDPAATPGNIEQNIGHGLSVLVICLPSALILVSSYLKTRLKSRLARAALCVCAAAGCLIIARLLGNFASLAAVIASSLALALALRLPRLMIGLSLLAPVLLLLLAPGLGIAAMQIDEQGKAALPFSWEWRVETWRYCAQGIIDQPLWGHGFDALRAVKATFDSRGHTALPVVPLHAHNAGLHIWYETGVIGIALLSSALLLGARHLMASKWLTNARAAALCGTAAAVTVFANLSYSAWQDWWLGAIAFAIAMTLLIKDDKTA